MVIYTKDGIIKVKLDWKRYCIIMAEKLMKEFNENHGHWKDKYSFERHKYFANQLKT